MGAAGVTGRAGGWRIHAVMAVSQALLLVGGDSPGWLRAIHVLALAVAVFRLGQLVPGLTAGILR